MTSESETTIYRRAVQPNVNQRDSTSSEDANDTSDEMIEVPGPAMTGQITEGYVDEILNQIKHNTIAGDGDRHGRNRSRGYDTEPRPGTSRDSQPRPSPEQLAQERSDYLVRQAEASKARILELPGNELDNQNLQVVERSPQACAPPQQHFVVDENYLVVGNYIDDNIRVRIENGEYVDFSHLLPRDRIQMEDDSRMEMVFRNGRTYFVPANTNTGPDSSINSFSRWEQAFRVFSNIYTNRYPHRSSELIQYNHIIYTASMVFTWENVYLYDCEFRLHMARFPQRSWAMILQQAWTMRLCDKIRQDQYYGRSDKKSAKKDVCWRYNKGRCTFGATCRFDHRCTTCNKFGHGAHICRKANKDKRDLDSYKRDEPPRKRSPPRRRSPSPPPPSVKV